MRNGFTFKNRHSSEFGVTVRTKSRPITAGVKSFTSDLPYRDGEYDFSKANPHGREHYAKRTFVLSLGITADNLAALQGKISKLALWLTGSGELIFDDLPLVVWKARVTDEIAYMPEHGGTKAELEVSFSAEPFGEALFGTEGPLIGHPLQLDSEIPLSTDCAYTYTLDGSGNICIVNFGDMPVSPVIKITGKTGGITLSLGGKTLSFSAGGKSVTADFEKQTVKAGDGLVGVTGEFFEIPAGINHVAVTNSAQGNIIITVGFKAKYMYGADYSHIDWGDALA